jgi:transcriptional regulator with XRE-family HTH domain
MAKIPRGHRMAPLNHDPEGLKYALDQSGLNQTQLAEKMTVSKSQVSEWLKGTRNVTPANLIVLARVLNCPRVVLQAKAAEPVDEPVSA